MGIPIVGNKGNDNRIVISFPNDHDIGGMKIDVTAVTAEQIAVAIFYLQRVASGILDTVISNQRAAAAEIADVARGIAAERN